MSSNPIALLKFQDGELKPVSINLIERTPSMTHWETTSYESNGLTHYGYAEFSDEGRLEIQAFRCSAEGYTINLLCKIRSFSSMVCQYIYNLAISGNTIIFPVDPFATILISESQRAHLEENWEEKYGDPVFCPSAEALEPLLAEGFLTWLNYRNRVIPEPEA
jgi:hypothetical protein